MKDIKYIDGDDWVGLYINGSLEFQGHSLSIEEFARLVEIPISAVTVNEAGAEYLAVSGYFPDTLEEWYGANPD